MLLAKHLTHLDLCTGIGGFTIAAGWAGFDTVGFAEIEPYCSRLLLQHWPGIPNYGDLRSADFSGLMGQITVLTAGVPCQPASLAGKRKGARDDRWLWPAVLDVVGSVEPAWCIFENPSGILSLGEFGGVLLRLESFGYQVRAFSVPANSVGAKHRRQRVFVVAYSGRQTERVRTGLCEGEQRGIGRRRSDNEDSQTLADADDTRLQRRDGGELRECSRERIAREGGASLSHADKFNGGNSGFGTGEAAQFETGRLPTKFRLTEPPLCRAVDGIPNRSHRLKALGNSVVPQQVYPFFQAISQTINHA